MDLETGWETEVIAQCKHATSKPLGRHWRVT